MPLVARTRSPLPALRTLLAEARAAVEGFDGDRGETGRPQDRAQWEQLCRTLSQREGAVERAERTALLGRTREGQARRKRTRAGTELRASEERARGQLVVTADAAALQRVAVCQVCERPAEVRGEAGVARLRDEGWGSVRRTDLPGWPRAWWCPTCWVPPRMPPEAEPRGQVVDEW